MALFNLLYKLEVEKYLEGDGEFPENYVKRVFNKEDLLKIFPKTKDKFAGIYCLRGKKGVPLYVGRSVNLRSRIKGHFSGSQYPINLLIHHVVCIEFVVFGDYKVYSNMYDKKYWNLLNKAESLAIKSIKPLFNGADAQRTVEQVYGYRNYRRELDVNRSKKSVEVLINKFLEIKERSSITMDDKVINSVKQSIKLAVKYLENEEADKVIEGLLEGIRKIAES